MKPFKDTGAEELGKFTVEELQKMAIESSKKLGEVLAEKFNDAREANQDIVNTLEKLALAVNRVAHYSKETREFIADLEKRVAKLEAQRPR